MTPRNIFVISIISLILVSSSGQIVLGYGGAPEQSSSNNYTVEIKSDNESYTLGDSVIFSGNVNKYDAERSLRISIFSGSNLAVTQKVPVDTDGTFTHEIPLNEKFSDGKFTVKAQYGNTKTTIAIISFVVNSNDDTSSQNNKIPDWIKNNAGWWAAGDIDDSSFVQGIQFLIKENFMKIPITEQGSSSQNNKIPDWIKNNAGWWAAGDIDDSSFVQGIQFLIKEGFMKL